MFRCTHQDCALKYSSGGRSGEHGADCGDRVVGARDGKKRVRPWRIAALKICVRNTGEYITLE